MIAEDTGTDLTETDRIEIFKQATRGFARRNADQFATGMTDVELVAALEGCLGIFGGSGGPDTYSVTYTGSGLRIWGGWSPVNHVREKPLFAGKATIAMARSIYGISDPNQRQLDLF